MNRFLRLHTQRTSLCLAFLSLLLYPPRTSAEAQFIGAYDTAVTPLPIESMRFDKIRVRPDSRFIARFREEHVPEIPELTLDQAQESIAQYKSLVALFLDRETRTLHIELLMRDAHDPAADPSLRTALDVALSRSPAHQMTALLARGDADASTEVTSHTSVETVLSMLSALDADGRYCRIAVFDGLLCVFLASADVTVLSQRVLARYVPALQTLITEVESAPNPVALAKASSALVSVGDDAFNALSSVGVANDALALHELDWQYSIRPRLEGHPQDRILLADLAGYPTSLALAAGSETCTIVVSGSRGKGATLRYASKADANRGDFAEAPTPTMVTLVLPKGSYVFKLFRDGKETGSLGPVHCDGTSPGIEVPESP